LRCPYETLGARTMHTQDIARSVILGSEGTAGEAISGPGVARTYDEQEPRMPTTRARRREYAAMKNWFDIIQPHEDIRKGDFDEAVFAADLGDVVDGSAPPDYGDPYLFFRKTYLTDGLRHLLTRVHGKLTAGKGQSVIEIQTPFGGGKTHSLVTIYHYLKNGEKVRPLLPEGLAILSPRMSVVVGTHHNPVEGRESDGITRRTFWGEIGYQLAGREGYRFFAPNDESRVSPGKAKLKEFLSVQQPFILLFDEILEYINRAAGVAYKDTTLAGQTFAFFQELTETVAALPQGMMVVTLPSSYLEDYGQRKEESLARLNKIFGRVESIETPVKGEEVYAIVRRRLFEGEVDEAARQAVIHDYFKLYQGYRDDLPPKARDLDFKHKMELAYPFHPDVIDILYEKWSTFSSFQRTRGVLRLLANVVEDLYQREVNIDLILPGDINLARPGVRQEFLKHIGIEYEGVIGSDIAGHEAKAQALDGQNRPWKHLAQRIATAVFFHSFSAGDSEKGIGLPYVKLATLRSDTMPALVTEVLQRLANALWYLNSRADVHYFSRLPNLNRMILDKKELFNEAYEDRLREIVRGEIGRKFTSYLWPENGDGIPDNRSLKLVVLHPEDSGAEIPAWIERRGETFRVYKNTLFFALPDTAAFARLKEDVKTYMALEEIKGEIDSGENPALAVKLAEIQRRMHNISRDFSFNVRRMYHTLQVSDRCLDLGQPVAGSETLSNWYWRELEDREEITARLHYRMLVNKFMAGKETVAAQAVLDQFYKDPGLPAPASTEVVARAIQLGIQEGAFGFAPAEAGQIDPQALRFRTELPLGAISFDEGFVLIERGYAEALLATLEAEEEEETVQVDTGRDTVTPTGTEVGVETGVGQIPTVPKPRYRSVRLVIADIPASRIADVHRGILMPITQAVGDFTFTLEVQVSDEEGISQATLENTVKETIRQIGARIVDERLE